MNAPAQIKPTCILEKPHKVRVGRYYLTMLVTDTGDFLIKDAEKLCGFTENQLVMRLGRNGWQYPNIFKPDYKGWRKRGGQGNPTDEWKKLKSKVRSKNLEKINLGSWELKQCNIKDWHSSQEL